MFEAAQCRQLHSQSDCKQRMKYQNQIRSDVVSVLNHDINLEEGGGVLELGENGRRRRREGGGLGGGRGGESGKSEERGKG